MLGRSFEAELGVSIWLATSNRKQALHELEERIEGATDGIKNTSVQLYKCATSRVAGKNAMISKTSEMGDWTRDTNASQCVSGIARAKHVMTRWC